MSNAGENFLFCILLLPCNTNDIQQALNTNFGRQGPFYLVFFPVAQFSKNWPRKQYKH